MMIISPAGLAAIVHNEGFRAEAYSDHKGQSIGYGHLILPGETFEGPITEERARDLLRRDLAFAEADVNREVKVSLTQEQFDALVDFCYNEGIVPLVRVATTLNINGPKAAVARMKLYIMVHDANGNLVESEGLKARRAEEAKAFEE